MTHAPFSHALMMWHERIPSRSTFAKATPLPRDLGLKIFTCSLELLTTQLHPCDWLTGGMSSYALRLRPRLEGDGNTRALLQGVNTLYRQWRRHNPRTLRSSLLQGTDYVRE